MPNELIERLEKLDGPDRETDALIEIEVRRLSAYAVGLDDQTRARWLIVGFKGEVEDGFTRYHSPEYTASLDAAIALVERKLPGWTYLLNNDSGNSADLFPPNWPKGKNFDATCATMPIAVLTTLLRALEGQE